MKKIITLLSCLFLCSAFNDPTPKGIFFEKGLASYYHQMFEGRTCSNGDIFRHNGLTAAHKTLKFGTMLRITNLKNDSVVIVKVNDRLPKKSKCCIDLTMRAAKQLNFVKGGITPVKIEILKDYLP
jgi:rare lipoprotein A